MAKRRKRSLISTFAMAMEIPNNKLSRPDRGLTCTAAAHDPQLRQQWWQRPRRRLRPHGLAGKSRDIEPDAVWRKLLQSCKPSCPKQYFRTHVRALFVYRAWLSGAHLFLKWALDWALSWALRFMFFSERWIECWALSTERWIERQYIQKSECWASISFERCIERWADLFTERLMLCLFMTSYFSKLMTLTESYIEPELGMFSITSSDLSVPPTLRRLDLHIGPRLAQA